MHRQVAEFFCRGGTREVYPKALNLLRQHHINVLCAPTFLKNARTEQSFQPPQINLTVRVSCGADACAPGAPLGLASNGPED
jgi:hypothetical protein